MFADRRLGLFAAFRTRCCQRAHFSLARQFSNFFEHTQFRLSHQAIHGRIVREKIPNYRANKVSRVNFDRRNAVQRASESLEFNVEAIVSK